jgi:hypothetical protein
MFSIFRATFCDASGDILFGRVVVSEPNQHDVVLPGDGLSIDCRARTWMAWSTASMGRRDLIGSSTRTLRGLEQSTSPHVWDLGQCNTQNLNSTVIGRNPTMSCPSMYWPGGQIDHPRDGRAALHLGR